ncbi:hypothetical protein LTR85_001477 [Meristemomyces frigidus]|nr:hypothetical protein LTR85_001477 [Meristemomyces frigidus]
MERLPRELLDMIVSDLDHASQKNLRLVNRRLEGVSTEPVLEHFYMGYFEDGFKNFALLAKSPLAKCVKSFTIYSDLMPEWTREVWESKIDFRPDYAGWRRAQQAQASDVRLGCEHHSLGGSAILAQSLHDMYGSLPRHSLSEEELALAFSTFQQLGWQQRDLEEDVEGLSLKQHLMRLPNLIQARLACATPFQGKTNEWPVWKRLRTQSILVGPDDWMYTDDHPMSDASLTRSHGRGVGQAALFLLEAVGHRAQYSEVRPVTHLSINSVHFQPYQSLMGITACHGTGETAKSVRYMTVRDAFRHLTSLELNIPHARKCATHGGPAVAEETVFFLLSATQLRRLDLTFTDDEAHQRFSEASDLMGIFTGTVGSTNQVVWPHLEHLALRTNVSGEAFIAFLRNHAKTLTSLELRDMVLHPDILEVVEQIPKALNLEHVYLECVWGTRDGLDALPYDCYLARGTDFDDDYERSVKAYLLGSTEELVELSVYAGGWSAGDSDSDGDHLSENDGDDNDDDDDEHGASDDEDQGGND